MGPAGTPRRALQGPALTPPPSASMHPSLPCHHCHCLHHSHTRSSCHMSSSMLTLTQAQPQVLQLHLGLSFLPVNADLGILAISETVQTHDKFACQGNKFCMANLTCLHGACTFSSELLNDSLQACCSGLALQALLGMQCSTCTA